MAFKGVYELEVRAGREDEYLRSKGLKNKSGFYLSDWDLSVFSSDSSSLLP